MAAKTTDWRPGPTVCRCCLSEGCYKDISTEYFWMGKREVYAEMLLDSLNLTIAYSQSGGPNSNSRLICEMCISRLRDASDFRRQVQECEKTFIQYLDPSTSALPEVEVTSEHLDTQVKVEPMKEEKHLSDDDFEDRGDFGQDDDDDDDLDDQPLTKLVSKMPKKESVDLLDLLDNAKVGEKRKSSSKSKSSPAKKAKKKETAKPTSSKTPKPDKKKKDSTQETDSNMEVAIKVEPLLVEEHYEDLEESDTDSAEDEILSHLNTELLKDVQTNHVRTSISLKKKLQITKPKGSIECENTPTDTQKDWMKVLERRGNGPILRENSLKLLANSNICVFQWNKSWYRCFCCKEPFEHLESLRQHTQAEHRLEDIEKIIITQQNKLVKVEISSIICKLCSKHLEDLNGLKQHLKEDHDIAFVTNEDLLVPFKINEHLQCQICFESYSVFRLLNIHMNKHFQKQICHICGTGWSNLVLLNLHKIRSHRPLVCKPCDVTFTSKSEKKDHDVHIHGVKFERKLRFPCPHCPERFYQENLRVLHLVDKHGKKMPQHKCNVCSKVFITRSLCNGHVKNVHKKEKNQECDVCHKLFYTKSDVLRHRVTHTGEKKHACSVCSSPFATKDSLRRHMKRTHMGVFQSSS